MAIFAVFFLFWTIVQRKKKKKKMEEGRTIPGGMIGARGDTGKTERKREKEK